MKQQGEGLAKVSLVTGKVTTIITRTNLEFNAVAFDSHGDLYYTLYLKPSIKKVSARALQNLPLTTQQLEDASTDYAVYSPTSPTNKISIVNMVFDSNDQLYISIYNKDSDNMQPGLLRLDKTSKSFEPVLAQSGQSITGMGFDPHGNLFFNIHSSSFPVTTTDLGIKKIPADALRSLPVTSDKVKNHKRGFNKYNPGVYSILFSSKGATYITTGISIERLFPHGLPIITLEGEPEVTVKYGHTYEETGAYVEDDKYSNLDIQTSYSLGGIPVEKIDENVPGSYQVHYNSTNPDQLQAREVIRRVTVEGKPASLDGLNLTNPGNMDYVNGFVYITNPANSTTQESGIYKVSVEDYSYRLIAELPSILAIAVNDNGDLYFSLQDDFNRIYKLEARYLNTSKTMSESDIMNRVTYIQPFTPQNTDLKSLQISGLDFDNQGRLYVAANQTGTDKHAWIARSTEVGLEKFQFFAEGDERIKLAMNNIQDIEISPGGNLYANFAGTEMASYHTIQMLPAAALTEDTPVLIYDHFKESNDLYRHNIGITFLANGDGYISKPDTSPKNIIKLPFTDPAPSSPVVEDTYRLENLNIQTPYTMDYYNDHVYVSQGNNGLSSISLSTRTVTQLVYGSPDFNFGGITIDSKGWLYYEVPDIPESESTYIKRIDTRAFDHTLTVEQMLAKSMNYAYLPIDNITGMDMDPNNRLYVTGSELGLTRWHASSKTLIPIVNEGKSINAVKFDAQGNLYFRGLSLHGNYSFTPGIVKINASDLDKTLPVPYAKMTSYSIYYDYISRVYDMVFLPDGKSYFSNRNSIKRVFPESRPVVHLKETSQKILLPGDLYVDPGIEAIEDEKYSDFDVKISYSLNGKPVSSWDTSIPGVYTIHYTAWNPAGIASLEKRREFIVQPAPVKLTDWNIPNIKGMDTDQKDVYIANSGEVDNPNNPNFGLYKISMKTMKRTQLAIINDLTAVAVNNKGDVFFTRSYKYNMIFKIEARYLQSGKVLSADELMQRSRTYTPFTAGENHLQKQYITGLDFDAKGRLYISSIAYDVNNTSSRIMRVEAPNWDHPTLIAAIPLSGLDMEITKKGNLYINVYGPASAPFFNKQGTYKISSEQLNQLPVPFNEIVELPQNQGDYGIVFFDDGTGYVSRTWDRQYNEQTILQLQEKD
ncbi:immunoglobulin-like domain-containing protein [Paenibacillus shenyangensis]|uniref:immunoglobulin-like domain-containing protein n=1 Tax=Paenibacillus sp. A9 TaxID=1284352 RepID=UPI0009D97927|nr:immunoglobulin-like domain-containing protein [Paenibacillus sp. A9]